MGVPPERLLMAASILDYVSTPRGEFPMASHQAIVLTRSALALASEAFAGEGMLGAVVIVGEFGHPAPSLNAAFSGTADLY